MLLKLRRFFFATPLTIRIRMLANCGVLGIAVGVGMQRLQARDQVSGPSSVQTHQIGVLLLPALDATKDAANMLAPRQAVIRHRQQVEFIRRQFKMLGEAIAWDVARTDPAVDLTQLSARTPENFESLAKRAGADWVVHSVVEDVDGNADAEGGFLVKTRMLIQVWDVQRHDWLVNQRYTGEGSGPGVPPMIFLRSLDNATKGALERVLAAYPSIVTLEGEDSLADYLAGQTAPVVGDPGKPFRVPATQ